jgi:rod shape-determining protein MreD
MRVVFYYLFGIVLLYVQVLVAPAFAFATLLPSFILGFIIYAATRLSLNTTAILAFLLGLGLDLLYPQTLGLQALALLTVSVPVNRLHEHLNKEKPVNVLLGILAANIIYILLFTLYHMAAYPSGLTLWIRVPLSLILNFLLASLEIFIFDWINRLRLVLYE